MNLTPIKLKVKRPSHSAAIHNRRVKQDARKMVTVVKKKKHVVAQ